MTRSIGAFMNDNVELIGKGKQPVPIEQCEAYSLIADHVKAVEGAALERETVERAEHEHRLAIEMSASELGGFPPRHVNAALSPFETPSLTRCREFLASRKLVLVLAGGVGCGKTTAATWAMLRAGGSAPRFSRSSSLERRGRYAKPFDGWLDGCSSLVIDDVGAEVVHDVFRSLLDEIIDTLYGANKRLVITTNLHAKRQTADDVPQFVERYGDRVASRLSEIGLWASCGSRDLRRDQLKLANGGGS